MKDYYLNLIYGKKRKHSSLYKSLQRKFFNKELNWSQMKEQSEDVLRDFAIQFRNQILLDTSIIDPDKLARAILLSRSGVGGAEVTPYICKLCGKEDVWSNTAIPGICQSCAYQMALQIAKYHSDILKDEYTAILKQKEV